MDGFDDEREESSRATMLVGVTLLLSALVHVVLSFVLSDCSFSGTSPVAWKSSRKWTKDVPVMQVRQDAGDPFAAERDAQGRPAAAPVVERESDRVERLVQVEAGGDVPRNALERTASAAPALVPEVKPQLETPKIVPRADVVRIDAPVVPDALAALPRRIEEIDPGAVVGTVELAPPATSPVASLDVLNGGGARANGGAGSSPVVDLAPAVDLPVASLDGLGSAGVGSFDMGERAADAASRRGMAPSPAGKQSDQPPHVADAAAEKVRKEVDERIVEQAKEAVRALRDEVEGEPFERNVQLDLAHWIDPAHPQRKYFRIRLSSDSVRPLPVVAKDVLYLLDASGSIADDRLKSCRRAVAEEIRRLNSNDRFNVVAFRDKFSYCFDGWRDVNSQTVEKAERWLGQLVAHGRTDVFGTLRSILAVPRAPDRPLVALVVTDGEPTSGLTRNAEIISRFSDLNGGLVSVYMYGVKEKANAYLMDMLARGNRGGWYRHDGIRWRAAAGIPDFAAKFADPVLSDVSVTFAAASRCDAYPRLVTNLYRSEPIEIWGVCPSEQKDVVFSVRGLNGARVYENVFRLSFDAGRALDESARGEWATRKLYALVADYTRKPSPKALAGIRDFAARFGLTVPYAASLAPARR